MYKRELEINGTPLSFETGKLREAGRRCGLRPHGRFGRPRHRVRRGQRARGHRLSSADGRLQGIHLRVGTHSWRVLQARRQAVREGSADQPGASIARSARCFRRAGGTRRQIIALVLSADANYDPDVLAITGASAALAISSIPFQKTIAGVRVGKIDGQYIINPTYEQRKKSTLDLVIAGQQGWPRDGRSGREGSPRRGNRAGARGRPRRHQAHRR